MKFIKKDGSIEEGTPLTEAQSELRDVLQTYLHQVVCEDGYHSTYSTRPCAKGANFLALAVNNSTDEPREYAEAVKKEIYRLTPKPEPVQPIVEEPVPAHAETISEAEQSTLVPF